MKVRIKPIILLLAFWLLLFCLLVFHINTKGTTPNMAAYFSNGKTYNFEYKLGYPTPWYSQYFAIPEEGLLDDGPNDIYQAKCEFIDIECLKTPTPPGKYLMYRDISIPVLLGQALIAVIPVFAIWGLLRFGKFVLNRK